MHVLLYLGMTCVKAKTGCIEFLMYLALVLNSLGFQNSVLCIDTLDKRFSTIFITKKKNTIALYCLLDLILT